jgi:hypothetical protein
MGIFFSNLKNKQLNRVPYIGCWKNYNFINLVVGLCLLWKWKYNQYSPYLIILTLEKKIIGYTLDYFILS